MITITKKKVTLRAILQARNMVNSGFEVLVTGSYGIYKHVGLPSKGECSSGGFLTFEGCTLFLECFARS